MIASKTSRKTVLVVDDEPHIVTYLEALLEDHGYNTIAAEDGEKALEIVRAEHPDLICLDISMPKRSGVGFYRRLKEDPQLAKTPMVVVTAVTGYGGDPESFNQFLSTRKQVPPPEGFIAKPIDKTEFLKLVEEALGTGK